MADKYKAQEALAVLTALPAFVETFPPSQPFTPQGPVHLVYVQPGVRWRVQLERGGDVGYGLWRTDALAEAGIDEAELDRTALVGALLDTLAPQLSEHLLEGMARGFIQAWHDAQASRQAACAKYAAGDGDGAGLV